MDIDWNKYMKEHHIKIYTEEELQKRRKKRTVHKMIEFAKRHEKEFLESYKAIHA